MVNLLYMAGRGRSRVDSKCIVAGDLSYLSWFLRTYALFFCAVLDARILFFCGVWDVRTHFFFAMILDSKSLIVE